MYSRVITMHVIPGKMDQAMHIFQDSMIPPLLKRKGYVDIFLMENRERNELISLSRWETEQDMLAVERTYFLDQQVAKLSTVLRESVAAVIPNPVDHFRLGYGRSSGFVYSRRTEAATLYPDSV